MKKERNNVFVPIFMIILLLVTIAIVIYGVDTYFFNNTWLSGDSWVSIIICLISSGATLILGFISYWQNKKQREDNIKAQEIIQENAKREVENLRRQREISVLAKNFDKYKDKLEKINAEIQRFHYLSVIDKIVTNIVESSKEESSSEERENRINESNELIKQTIISLNYIHNTILYQYNKYFIDETEPLILNAVRTRQAIENFSHSYLRLSLEKDEVTKEEKYKKMKDDIFELCHQVTRFETDWQNYLMKIIEYFEILEYNDSPEKIIAEMNASLFKIQKLRTKVNQLEKEHKQLKTKI